jgi:uncharacterized protein YdgA (DUF945 family)
MKKLLAIFLGIVLFAASAYAASAFYFGREVETVLAAPYKALEGEPYVKLVKRDYQRGVFTSTETVTIEVLGDIARATGGSPMLLTAKSQIVHGPMPAVSLMAAAVVDTDLFIGGGGLPTAGQLVMKAHTVISHEGNGELHGTVQPTVIEFQGAVVQSLKKVTLSGGEFKMQFSPEMTEYTDQGSMPGLELDMADGGRVVMTGIRMDQISKLVLPDEPALRGGAQKFTIDQMQIHVAAAGTRPVVVNKIAYDTDVPVSGEFLDVSAKMRITDILVGDQNYGPAQLDLSVKKLHARSLAKMQKAMARMQATAGSNPAADPMSALQPMLLAMTGVLQHDPEISIDRLSFNTPSGEVQVAAKVQFPGVTAEDAQNLTALSQKIVAVAELAVPEALLMMPVGPGAATAQVPGRAQQIASLVEHGYVHRDGALMKSKLEFRGNQLAINGMPFDPMALQGRPMLAGPAMAPPTGRPQMLQNVPIRR